MIDAPVGHDHEVGCKVGRVRFHEHMGLCSCAAARFCVTDNPSRGVAGGHGQDRLARFECDIGDALRRRLNGVKGATLVPEFKKRADGRGVGGAAQGSLVRLLQRRRLGLSEGGRSHTQCQKAY